MSRWTDGWMEGLRDEWIDGCMEGWLDAWIIGCTCIDG